VTGGDAVDPGDQVDEPTATLLLQPSQVLRSGPSRQM
jgi:hypothetical protein